MTQQQAEQNAADKATVRAINRQELKVRKLRFDVDGAKKDVQQLVDDLHTARVREEQLRADLVVEETQLWRLRHPAKDVVVGVNIHGDPDALCAELGRHMREALKVAAPETGRVAAAEGTAAARRGGGAA